MHDVAVAAAPSSSIEDGRRAWRDDHRRWLSPLAHLVVFAAVAEVALARLSEADAAPNKYTYRSCGDAYAHGAFGCNLEHPPLAKELIGIGTALFGDTVTVGRVTTALFAIG